MAKTGFSGNPKLEFLYLTPKDWTVDPEFLDGRHAILLENISFVDKKGRKHTAKAGLVTDGGSIPRRLWDEIGGPYMFCLLAYIIHDWYCERARHLRDNDGEGYDTLRKEADDLFLEMLEWINDNIGLIKVTWLKRRAMYRGVRIGSKF